MPFQEEVSDEKILSQFERNDLDRQGFTYSEIAEGVDEVTPEAVRQRLVRMSNADPPKVESVKVGGVRLWHLPGEEVFAPVTRAYASIGLLTGWPRLNFLVGSSRLKVLLAHFALLGAAIGYFWLYPERHFAAEIGLITVVYLAGFFGGLVSIYYKPLMDRAIRRVSGREGETA